jgi:simple sugar transport system substrate-binding protein
MNDKTGRSEVTLPEDEGALTRRGLIGVAGAAGLGLAFAATASKQAGAASFAQGAAKPVFYWISHGAAGDQIWVLAVNGANAAAKDLDVTVRASFHNNDVASQVDAINAAIAARAKGIATTSPQPGVLKTLVRKAAARGIPVVTLNSDDPATGRIAYVGADLTEAGQIWANYLVTNKLVKAGDKVWLPVEAAGASYQVLETQGIASVFRPRGIKFEVFNAGGDPAKSQAAMQDYLTAKGKGIAAMIGLGDQVTSNTPKVFRSVGWKPGRIPVVGWGNTLATAQAVQQGYIKAGLWQYPDSQGYLPIVLLKLLSDGRGAGYDVTTLALYDRKNVGKYIKYLR